MVGLSIPNGKPPGSVAVFRTLFGDGHWGSSSQKTLAIWLKPQTSFGPKTEIEMSTCDPKMVGPSLAVLSRNQRSPVPWCLPWPRLVPKSQSPHLCPCHPMWLTECRSIPWWKKTCSIMFLINMHRTWGQMPQGLDISPAHPQPIPSHCQPNWICLMNRKQIITLVTFN